MRLLDYMIHHLRPYYGLSGPMERRLLTPEPPPDLLLDATPWPGPTEEDNQTEKEERNTTITTSNSSLLNDQKEGERNTTYTINRSVMVTVDRFLELFRISQQMYKDEDNKA